MTKTSAASIENFVPEMAIFGLPYLFRDEAHYWNVLNSELGRSLLQKGNAQFLKGLCYYDSGSRNFYTVNRPVRTPNDLRGLKIRVMNSRTAMDMVEYLGASPTPIAWGELYSSLAQGTVDGAENNPPSFTSNKHYEVCKHFSLDAHTRIPDMLLISTRVWDRLSPQIQECVQQAADESSVFQRKLWQEETLKSLEQTIHEVDQTLFSAKVQPMYDAIGNTLIRDLVTQIREVE
jgi:tripartite ATP-independent transporter DctP family solute receptor